MTPSLDRRVAALEERSNPDGGPLVIFVQYVSPKNLDPLVSEAHCGDLVFLRRPGEETAAFKQRVRVDVLKAFPDRHALIVYMLPESAEVPDATA